METFTPLIAGHAIAALFVLVLGPFQILRPRRDLAHRILGASWVVAMLGVCVSSFWIHDGSFSWLHGLALWTILCLVFALAGIRRGNVPIHRGFMVGSYLGTLAAFAFAALIPQRLIPRLVTSEPVVAIGTLFAVALTVLVWFVAVTRTTSRLQRDDAAAAVGS
ncbi:MAG: DUF2306 domain-containing protein [Propionibacteriaceae bacterium]|nr:DUF2306 domain-containing protein [Propionibacteriaceae bacterium]